MPRKGNAFLLIDSTDRYLSIGANIGTQADALRQQFQNTRTNQGNNFSIQSPGNLINGYMGSLMITQIQMQYKIPTICPRNDTLLIQNQTTGTQDVIKIPVGFYTPLELAVELQRQFRASVAGAPNFQVILNSDTPPGGSGFINGFFNNPVTGVNEYAVALEFFNREYTVTTFKFVNVRGDTWRFVDPSAYPGLIDTDAINNVYRTYRTLGIIINACEYAQNIELDPNLPAEFLPLNEKEGYTPQFIYTPYIDIQSFALTQYQKIKDTDTSASKKTGLVARVYLSGSGVPQQITTTACFGSAPFTVTADLNNPKIVEWSPDQYVANLDFKLYDQYGELIYWDTQFDTEFQMSLLVSE